MEKATKPEDTIKIALAKLYVVLGVQQLKYDETILDNADFVKQWNNISKTKEGLKHMSVKRKEGWVPIPTLVEHFLEDEAARFQKDYPNEKVATVTFDMLQIKRNKIIEVISKNFHFNMEKYMGEINKPVEKTDSPKAVFSKRDQIEVIQSERLSKKEPRYVVVDSKSGKIIDDAHGYGYKSQEKAFAGYRHFKEEQKCPVDTDVISGSIKAVRDAVLSKNGDRYVIVDTATGEILDNAGGYGYKTKENAKTAYFYRKKTNNLSVLEPKVKKKNKKSKKKLYPPEKRWKYGIGYTAYGK